MDEQRKWRFDNEGEDWWLTCGPESDDQIFGQDAADYLNALEQRVRELTGPFPDTQSNWTKDQWKQLAMLARHRAEQAEAERDKAIEVKNWWWNKERPALEDFYQVKLAQAKTLVQQLQGALREIKQEQGKVCADFELCTHAACNSSYASWAIADAALTADIPRDCPHCGKPITDSKELEDGIHKECEAEIDSRELEE